MKTIEEKKQRCAQCYKPKPLSSFTNKLGKSVQRCADCRDKYGRWGSMTFEEKLKVARFNVPSEVELRAKLYPNSKNHKLGGIPSSITSRTSCPSACSFHDTGCYAGYGNMATHWRRVGEQGDTWDDFCKSVSMLPPGILWRHNVAGDLPIDRYYTRGASREIIDQDKLEQLTTANGYRRGFTFTHHGAHKKTMRRTAAIGPQSGAPTTWASPSTSRSTHSRWSMPCGATAGASRP